MARWAPSFYNHQPWSFIVATKAEPTEDNRLLSMLIEFNQGWARATPVLNLAVAKLHFDDGKLNRYAFHDVGLVLENLVLQATALGLSVHQAAGFDVEKAREDYQIPAGCEAATVLMVGYAGDSQALSDGLRDRDLGPRTSKPLQEFVLSGQRGDRSSFMKDFT